MITHSSKINLSLILLTKERVIILKANKKTIILILILLIVIGVTIVLVTKNGKKESELPEITEYTPQEEISSEQLRQTLITLFFKNKETGELVPEARILDSKLLLNNPYNELIKLLIEGPKNESLEKLIPEGTTVNNVEISKGIVYIDFSEEFTKVGILGAEEENKIIYSIVNTLTELTEVSGIKILINGEENMCFEDGEVNFNDIFVRISESTT